MDTGQLLSFDRIVEEGSFSRAAEALGVSQPTVSTRMRSLEAEVGGALIERGVRPVALTPLGEGFLPYARRALLLLTEGAEVGRLAQAGKRGRVTLGTIESLAGAFLAPVVTRFLQSHPDVELYVRAQHSTEIVAMLQDGLLRLGLITWPHYGADLVTRLELQEPLHLIAPASHPLAGAGSVTLQQVAADAPPLLAVRWGPLHDPLMARLQTLGGPPVEVPIETARRMVLAGAGTALLSRTLVAEALQKGEVVILPLADPPPHRRKIALVHLRQVRLSPADEALVALLEQVARELTFFA